MRTAEFMIAMFCRIDDNMQTVSKHPHASWYPSEVVTVALLFVLKGTGTRAFYRWIRRDYHHLFPALPHRPRLFRLFATHRDWSDRLLAQPTIFGVIDAYGIAFIHPIREGRSDRQIVQVIKKSPFQRKVPGKRRGLCRSSQSHDSLVVWAPSLRKCSKRSYNLIRWAESR